MTVSITRYINDFIQLREQAKAQLPPIARDRTFEELHANMDELISLLGGLTHTSPRPERADPYPMRAVDEVLRGASTAHRSVLNANIALWCHRVAEDSTREVLERETWEALEVANIRLSWFTGSAFDTQRNPISATSASS